MHEYNVRTFTLTKIPTNRHYIKKINNFTQIGIQFYRNGLQ